MRSSFSCFIPQMSITASAELYQSQELELETQSKIPTQRVEQSLLPPRMYNSKKMDLEAKLGLRPRDPVRNVGVLRSMSAVTNDHLKIHS